MGGIELTALQQQGKSCSSRLQHLCSVPGVYIGRIYGIVASGPDRNKAFVCKHGVRQSLGLHTFEYTDD